MTLEDDRFWGDLRVHVRGHIEQQMIVLERKFPFKSRSELLITVQEMIPALIEDFLKTSGGQRASAEELLIMRTAIDEVLERMIREASN